jgi:DEAD/DEAH box helicase domain-containing protein
MSTRPSLFPDTEKEIFFDIESLRLTQEVDTGSSNIAKFGLAVAVSWDAKNQFRQWFEQDVQALIFEMGRFARIISFNGDGFDFEVLRSYHSVGNVVPKSFDLLADLHRKLGFRIKFDDLASETLGNKKTGHGLEIAQWWRDGRKQEVCKNCENGVQSLVDLVEFARKKKYVVVNKRLLSVDWD